MGFMDYPTPGAKIFRFFVAYGKVDPGVTVTGFVKDQTTGAKTRPDKVIERPDGRWAMIFVIKVGLGPFRIKVSSSAGQSETLKDLRLDGSPGGLEILHPHNQPVPPSFFPFGTTDEPITNTIECIKLVDGSTLVKEGKIVYRQADYWVAEFVSVSSGANRTLKVGHDTVAGNNTACANGDTATGITVS